MLPVIINLWAIYHAMRHNFPKDGERGLWVALAIFLPILGGVLYFIFGFRRSLPLGFGPISEEEEDLKLYQTQNETKSQREIQDLENKK